MTPPSTADVYGGADELPFNLQTGLKLAQDLASKRSSVNKDVTRYAMSLLHLESRLNKTPKMLATIGQRLEQIGEQAMFFNSQTSAQEATGSQTRIDIEPRYAHPSVIGNLANLYQETLSTFSFRIQVTGEPRNLKNNDNADKIRALLLAGIRAAILWRQVGGRRWHLLFFRSRVGKSAGRILAHRRSH
jgi:high frequency lysogenization protein